MLKKYFNQKNIYHLIFILIFVIGIYLRFSDLGYSSFYGDETKTFYLDKTVSASKYFFDQRKGPVQFLVVWLSEKIVGGHDELLTRIPFALAGSLSIIGFYLVVKKMFSEKVALVATALFALNGFYIAFSRTIQYQSFLLLFGFFSIYLCLKYLENKKIIYAIISSVLLGLAYLSHYDAVFFNVVIAFYVLKNILEKKVSLKEITKYYLLPLTLVVGAFYLPYIVNGFMSENTVNYLSRRLSGFEYGTNSSWYTFWVYNPSYIWIFASLFAIPYFFKKDWKSNIILFWFLIPFIIFEFGFSNPGTHIHNYFIPLFIIIALGIDYIVSFVREKKQILVYFAILAFIVAPALLANAYVYLPVLNNGFPWKDSKLAFMPREKVDKRYHLFLYGFPYERGWREISEYINKKGGVRQIFTNDNDTAAQYYLRGIAYTIPGPNFLPQYYLEVFDGQEFMTTEQVLIDNSISKYTVEREFFVGDVKTAVLYKLNSK